jgi:RNA polymerase sigma-70 factor (ECF subfamily)
VAFGPGEDTARRRYSAPRAESRDVFVRLQRGLPGLRDEERFTSWLFQIARNSVVEHHRSRARHPLPDAGADADLPAASTEDDLSSIATAGG